MNKFLVTTFTPLYDELHLYSYPILRYDNYYADVMGSSPTDATRVICMARCVYETPLNREILDSPLTIVIEYSSSCWCFTATSTYPSSASRSLFGMYHTSLHLVSPRCLASARTAIGCTFSGRGGRYDIKMGWRLSLSRSGIEWITLCKDIDTPDRYGRTFRSTRFMIIM